mmetsp:Transcript_37178/g.43409  ORF Transcript_37178/g.43409 Transcript_37178/m.43409 type:complete len:150 (-) Transcript_37178:176-625(-)|eukprot:CAMPEP_0176438072 /NCGR_PEP_ID=MMETSP0127-20121128/19049_1 /TAXON_ID=938130 /ORGANISM="Platyophrya macrostoma, Strain WH" /LENGTH=149 /DNA_ID=CAMNT_0017821919 /DNA_START=48 /DNA_END=497 /DNA_ORIENTATION=-
MAGQNTNETSTPVTKLCSACNQFYGQEATGYLCSACFKNGKAKSETQTTTVLPQVSNKHVESKEEAKVEQVKIEAVQEQEPKKVIDTSRCLTCSKKVGLLGFKCQCEFTFCRSHRMPELHDCAFDFQKKGKEMLAKQNILVQAEKVTKF